VRWGRQGAAPKKKGFSPTSGAAWKFDFEKIKQFYAKVIAVHRTKLYNDLTFYVG
jgi:hypothetical protein